MKIVCVPDSFKGSVTAAEAAAALAAGARQVCDEAEILQLPFADGGEGTLDALLAVWGRAPERVATVDALGRETEARYGLSPDGRTAIIEAAEANGLPQVSDVPLQPLRADTYGVGLIARHVLEGSVNGTQVEEILLCIGGSSTTDGGTGILRGLGVEFLDDGGAPVQPGGEGLGRIASIEDSGLPPRAGEVRWRIAVDVDNPLTGQRGAAAVFGPQKGAEAEEIKVLDEGLGRLAEVLAAKTGERADSYRSAEGFGAAGGIPLTLVSLLGAEVVPGSTMVAEAVGLEEVLAGADLVLTGEGRLDSQSLGGKVVDAVASRAPDSAAVVVIAGAVQLSAAECRAHGITAAFSIAPGAADLAELQAEAAGLIEDTAAHACALWKLR
ncbi:glycerate kinase [Nesterenkonia muleiensis]|uniref:glycerate kinase n=1 Tax=Nesterenkonia muleiensis TaxID=2282648 RepID=UPI000E717C31|nr:glycerate kinase [Nesterenkonia muleiensis]